MAIELTDEMADLCAAERAAWKRAAAFAAGALAIVDALGAAAGDAAQIIGRLRDLATERAAPRAVVAPLIYVRCGRAGDAMRIAGRADWIPDSENDGDGWRDAIDAAPRAEETHAALDIWNGYTLENEMPCGEYAVGYDRDGLLAIDNVSPAPAPAANRFRQLREDFAAALPVLSIDDIAAIAEIVSKAKARRAPALA